jgi:hypothetical protein
MAVILRARKRKLVLAAKVKAAALRAKKRKLALTAKCKEGDMNGDTIDRIARFLERDESRLPDKVSNSMILIALREERDARKREFGEVLEKVDELVTILKGRRLPRRGAAPPDGAVLPLPRCGRVGGFRRGAGVPRRAGDVCIQSDRTVKPNQCRLRSQFNQEDGMEQAIYWLVGAIGMPVINWLKGKFGLAGKAAMWLMLAVSVVLGALALWLEDGLSWTDFTPENLLAVVGQVLAAATLAYNLLRGK